MARIYEDFIDGFISEQMGPSTTTLTSAFLDALPVIEAPDTATLVLDPQGTAGAPEIVRVTDYPGSSNEATVERGQDGTDARTHEPGTRFILSWVASDVAELLDIIEQLDNDLGLHVADAGNPHGVTAEQAGALPIGGGTLVGPLGATYISSNDDGTGDYEVSGDGAAKVELQTSSQAGRVYIAAAATNLGSPGDPITYAGGLQITPTGASWSGTGNLNATQLGGVAASNYARTNADLPNGSSGSPSLRWRSASVGIYSGAAGRVDVKGNLNVAGTLTFTNSANAGIWTIGGQNGPNTIIRFSTASTPGTQLYIELDKTASGVGQVRSNGTIWGNQGIGGEEVVSSTNVRIGTRGHLSSSTSGDGRLILRGGSGGPDGLGGEVMITPSNMSGGVTSGMTRLDLGSVTYRWGTLYTTSNPDVSSDERLKKNIHPIRPRRALQLVREVSPVSFDRIDGEERREYGWIAQDLEPFFNGELVTADSEGFLSIRPGELAAVVAAAVQELDSLVLELRDEVAELRARLEA